MRELILLLLLACALSVGAGCAHARRIAKVIPESPDPNDPVMECLNPNAQCLVIMVNKEEVLAQMADHSFDYKLAGLFAAGPGKPKIYLLGTRDELTTAGRIFVHEYQHFLESQMPDQAKRLRHCFLMLRDDAYFDFSQLDLAEEIK